jgi:hypothetical protein
MSGLIENILVARYGSPEIRTERGLTERSWQPDGDTRTTVLHFPAVWSCLPASAFLVHQPLYGDCCGGTLIGGALKLATICSHEIFGLYTMPELMQQPSIIRARQLDPNVAFFADAANIWFYGHKRGMLFVYDAETDELDELGALTLALEQVIGEWERSEKQ